MTTVNPEQVATRRRAYGRLLTRRTDDLVAATEAMAESQDRSFLTAKEHDLMDKQLAVANKVGANLRKIAERLEAS